MTFRRLFPNTVPAKTHKEAAARVRALFREWLREAPRMVSKFDLDQPVATLRVAIRAAFEQNRNVRDIAVVNTLVLRGTMQLIEVHNKWAQRTHVEDMFWGPAAQARRMAVVNRLLVPGGGAISFPNATPFLSRFLSPPK